MAGRVVEEGKCRGWENIGAEEQLGGLLEGWSWEGGWQQEGNVECVRRFRGGGAAWWADAGRELADGVAAEEECRGPG